MNNSRYSVFSCIKYLRAGRGHASHAVVYLHVDLAHADAFEDVRRLLHYVPRVSGRRNLKYNTDYISLLNYNRDGAQ